MKTQQLASIISRPCVDHEHNACHLDVCGCNCHHVCDGCGRPSDGGYDVSQEIGVHRIVCAGCYLIEIHGDRRHHCESCGADDAYHVKLSDSYLCMKCHGAVDRHTLTTLHE